MRNLEFALVSEQIGTAGLSLTLLRGGEGPMILVLHDEWGIRGDEELWSLLAKRFEIVAPIAPGFEGTVMSGRIRTPRDLAMVYNALLEQLSETAVTVIGISFGAWVAIEMALMNRSQIKKLILLGPVGMRFGTPDQRNFADLFALSEKEIADVLYRNPDAIRMITSETPREEIVVWAKNREAVATYAWEPYFHTAGIEHWTQHLLIPVHIIHGDEDRFVMDGYYEQYASSFPECSRVRITDSGHFPHLDAPRSTFEAIAPLLP